jgi:TetR/AcrR family transcriptional regulator, transcriptional repressor for nem operon
MAAQYVQYNILGRAILSAKAWRSEGMPYPEGHKARTRERIVESARRLFNRHGFDGVSIGAIMAGAGLTHGAFYSHFHSKSDLYTEVLSCFFTDPDWKNCWDSVSVDLASRNAGAEIVRAYLSRQHFENVENSCPMIALPGDVSRSSDAAKRAFEKVFAAMVDVLAHDAAAKGKAARGNAQAIAALCIGGMVVARAMENRAAADDLRDACQAVALRIGDWTKGRRGSTSMLRGRHQGAG